ncbi:MAG TPA: hypothetical protein VEA16_20350 [Vicinamibacterales bacterium]|nr:hypothetical protein [Vicinamibacterales bacterium]
MIGQRRRHALAVDAGDLKHERDEQNRVDQCRCHGARPGQQLGAREHQGLAHRSAFDNDRRRRHGRKRRCGERILVAGIGEGDRLGIVGSRVHGGGD